MPVGIVRDVAEQLVDRDVDLYLYLQRTVEELQLRVDKIGDGFYVPYYSVNGQLFHLYHSFSEHTDLLRMSIAYVHFDDKSFALHFTDQNTKIYDVADVAGKK